MMGWRVLGRLWTALGYFWLRSGQLLAAHWPEDEKSNCYIWAVQQFNKHGGEFKLTPSKFGPWLHCIWLAPDGTAWEFHPPSKQAVWTTPCRKRWQGFISFFKTFPPLIFHGKAYQVKNGNY